MNHPYVPTVKVPLPDFCRARVSFLVLEFQDQIRCPISCSCNNMPCTNSRFCSCQEHTVAANWVEGFSRPDQLVSVREAHLSCCHIRRVLSYV